VDAGVGARIAEVRADRKLNKRGFAETLGIADTVISNVESGVREPSKELLLNISIKYAISLNWLYLGVGEKSLVAAINMTPKEHPVIHALENMVTDKTMQYSRALTQIHEQFECIDKRFSELESRLIGETQKYPPNEPGGGYTAEPEPEYGEPVGPVAFREQIAAGPPVDQSDDESMVVDVPLRYIKANLDDYYALRIRGNSMIDALIPDGSLVLIRKSDTPVVDGAIQVVSVDGQTTLKRLREGEDHRWTICYEDGSGRTITLSEGLRVQGDFVAVLPPSTRPRMRGEE
jgi:SOS-response transcriptional repressor LexA/DNA-binding XRE family transcriptional regulator